MIVGVDVSTRVIGIDENHCDGILIGSSLEAIEIDLPVPCGEEIVFANLEAAKDCTSIIVGIAWPWKQNVGGWFSTKGIYDNLYCLVATSGDVHILSFELCRKVSVKIVSHRSVRKKNIGK